MSTCRGLLLLLALLPLPVPAQYSADLVLQPDSLDYYLWRAFTATGMQQRPALNHIGIQASPQDSGFLVTAALEGYPAHAAGIERGDIITTVDGQPYHPVYSFNDSAGAPADFLASNRSHTLELTRDGDSISMEVRPVYENLYDSYRSAALNSVQEFAAGNKVIGYLRLWSLSRSTHDLLVYRQLLRELDHCDGIVLDLRNSVGFLDLGHLDAIQVNRGNLFQVEGGDGWFEALAISNAPPVDSEPYRKPMVVLVNESTRGGPELLAYQLAKLQRVVTLGQATAGQLGEFSVDRSVTTPALRYQPGSGRRVDGQALEGRGVAPETSVPWSFDQVSRTDPQFEAAVNQLMGVI